MTKSKTSARQENQDEHDHITLSIYSQPGHIIRRLNQASVSIFIDEASKAGIDLTTVQYATLKAIEVLPGIDQTTVAGAIAYDQVTIAGVIARLERRDLISRRSGVMDRRSKLLYLKPAGRKLLEKMVPIEGRVQQKVLGSLPSRDQKLFMSLANRIADSINDYSRAPLKRIKRSS